MCEQWCDCSSVPEGAGIGRQSDYAAAAVTGYNSARKP